MLFGSPQQKRRSYPWDEAAAPIEQTSADKSRSTGAQSTGSQVSTGRPAYQAPNLPKRESYVPQQDIEKYYSMLGNAPQRKDPGKASQVLSVLSDLFLHQDIPGNLREQGYQRQQERYKSQLDPLKARLDAGEKAYSDESERVAKQGALGAAEYNANKPDGHYYTGVGKGGPAEMYSRDGGAPTEIGPYYEKPEKPTVPTLHYDTLKGPHGEPQVTAITPEGGKTVVGEEYQKPTGDKTGADYTKRQRQLSDQLSGEFRSLEAKRSSELDKLRASNASLTGQTLDPQQYQAEVDRIEEEHADAKQRVHEHYASLAAGEGIDLGTAPDYQAQLRNSRQSGQGQQTGQKPAGETKIYQGYLYAKQPDGSWQRGQKAQ